MIKKVTITGADESISPSALIGLSEKYPFVEWGILVSKNNWGSNRFPSIGWIRNLKLVKDLFPEMNLSCHLCSDYVRKLVKGNVSSILDLGELWDIFDRVQINFHAIPHEFHPNMFRVFRSYKEKEFIFQYDDVNTLVVSSAIKEGIRNISALFDLSHGAGVLPSSWPELIDGIKCGYAGGISPDNIESQILLINGIVKNSETWIDMETKVRSEYDRLFDLGKVERCLEISSKHIDK